MEMWSDENILAHKKKRLCDDLEHLNSTKLNTTAGTVMSEHLEPHLVAGCSMGCVHTSHVYEDWINLKSITLNFLVKYIHT